MCIRDSSCVVLHRSNEKDLRSAFKGFMNEFDCTLALRDRLTSDLLAILRPRAKPVLPLRPPRIIVLGCSISGRYPMGSRLAQRFGLVNVSAGDILRREIANKTPLGEYCHQAIHQKKERVPDDIISTLVEEELKKSESRELGWCIEGFPRNSKQFHQFLKWGFWPNVTIILDGSSQFLHEKQSKIMIDERTGRRYDLSFNLNLEADIVNRLNPAPKRELSEIEAENAENTLIYNLFKEKFMSKVETFNMERDGEEKIVAKVEDFLNSITYYSQEKKNIQEEEKGHSLIRSLICLLYTSPSPRDGLLSRMPSSA
eukprot:TRINITY_DN10927_c0_g1_i2.p1 TRINITY_DN10927_c0_g1~~TRINITY_DN10927_c0_g1_i2.p1  ORF type:complete len:334 (-),score=54.34 TRINITY_DN10927_c0_g1_i2:11-952(-)